MPKETFFNLSREKRELICEVAVDEFANHTFHQASINRIVEKSGIAKGSFYQYFENKDDLFMYLIGRIGEEKVAYIGPVLAQAEQYGFFDFFRALSRAGIEFALENPRYIKMTSWMMEAPRDAKLEKLLNDGKKQTEAFFTTLLQKGIADGEVRPDIDLSTYSHLLNTVFTAMFDNPDLSLSTDFENAVTRVVDTFIDLLKYGIAVEQLELQSSK